MTFPEIQQYAGAYRQALQEHPDDFQLNSSVAMCYLRLGLYDQAIPAFEKAVADNFDNAEIYFYAGISLLRGKRPFLSPKAEVERILQWINAACMIAPLGIYYYFAAYVTLDFYDRKHLRAPVSYDTHMQSAIQLGVSPTDVQSLFAILKTDVPPEIMLRYT